MWLAADLNNLATIPVHDSEDQLMAMLYYYKTKSTRQKLQIEESLCCT
jgi:hypothetical protein